MTEFLSEETFSSYIRDGERLLIRGSLTGDSQITPKEQERGMY